MAFVPTRFVDQGISRYDLAVKALKRALAAMPSEDLTPAQEKQRDHYEQELAAAQVKLTVSVLPGVVTIENSAGKLPWDRAAAHLPELCAQGIWDSSVSSYSLRQVSFISSCCQAWIIDHAYHVCVHNAPWCVSQYLVLDPSAMEACHR